MQPGAAERLLARESSSLASDLLRGNGTFEMKKGLTSKEAARRLREDGPNELDPPQGESFLRILLTQMRNMIFMLTTCAATLCWIIGDEVKAYVLLGIVSAVCLANTVGEYSAQDAAAALQRMTAPKAQVVRDGLPVQVESRDLVLGDVVLLESGDIVPADMIVLESNGMQTNESALTGEADEQAKTVERTNEESTFPPNMVYAATSLVAGSGRGEVVATGMRTQVGLIAKRLKHQDETLNVSPLQRSINLLGTYIGGACLAVVIVATLTSYLSKYQNPMTPCADDDEQCLLVTSVIRGLILAVSLIPHGLPFIVMVMLRVGSHQMYKRNAIVTRQSTVDYLGATTVICTDKTGTLTEGKMTAQALVGLCRPREGAAPEASPLLFYPLRGTNPNGGLFSASQLTEEAKRAMDDEFECDGQEMRQAFSRPGLPDLAAAGPGAAEEPGASADALLARAHLACAFLHCHGTSIVRDAKSGQWATSGSMTEAALKVAAAKGGLFDAEGRGAKLLRESHPRDPNLEVPFTAQRKMMATVHQLPADRRLEALQMPSDCTHFAIVKGAPDKLLPKLGCVPTMSVSRGVSSLIIPGEPMSAKERELVSEKNLELSKRALRTILVGVRPLRRHEAEAMKPADIDGRLAALLGPPGLCFLSLWGIYDPPRVMVRKSVDECHCAGIRVVMITGDQRPTAVAIARQVQILREEEDPDVKALPCEELHEHDQLPERWRRKLGSSEALEAAGARTRAETDIEPDTGVDRGALPGPRERWHSSLSALAGPRVSPRRTMPASMEERHRTLRNLVVHDSRDEHDQHEKSYRSSREIAARTAQVNVWSRAHPTDKVAIVSSLGKQGHITAMTGDGVNDAPALKHAMVGVSMGISGTEVAKKASELILMDDDFSTIVAAIREGRKIYANVQKYVVFNLSIKAGECTSLILAIASGVPMPIRGLQLLFNLLCTHIIPTMALAWEEAEPHLMRVPPRSTRRDLVVPPVMWLFRWLPFVICMPTMVLSCVSLAVWMHTGFVQGNSIIGSSRVGALDEGLVACEYAGRLDVTGRFIDDRVPFHCQCRVRLGGMPWSQPALVDQWGRPEATKALDGSFDRWTGATGDVFEKAETPWGDGVDGLLEPCKDRRGVLRWCWRDKELSPEALPALPAAQNCGSYGARLGQTMAYVTIHLGEIFSLLTFRMDDLFVSRTFSNPVFNGLMVFNLGCLACFLYVPPLREVLELAPLTAGRFALAACFSLCLGCLNEAAKVLYRRHLKRQNVQLEEEAGRRASGEALSPNSCSLPEEGPRRSSAPSSNFTGEERGRQSSLRSLPEVGHAKPQASRAATWTAP